MSLFFRQKGYDLSLTKNMPCKDDIDHLLAISYSNFNFEKYA